VKDEPNLYIYDADANPEERFAFIATLSAADARTSPPDAAIDPSTLSPIPVGHAARVTPDGGAVAFMSTASPTGYDNHDASSGEPDREVYRYDAASRALTCVSCNPSGSRPIGAGVNVSGAPVWTAARIPGAQHQLYFSRVLSASGNRLFFESYEALVLRDTNGRRDVYQWEMAGEGGCTGASGSFSAAAEGCVSLITSGEDERDSSFLDASPSGDDVFVSTGARLVGEDPGLVDIYDARVGGGIEPPPAPPAPCEGEACQSPAPPPGDITPASSVFKGAPNLRPRPRCGEQARAAAKLRGRAKRLRRRSGRVNGTVRSRLLHRKARRLAKRARTLNRKAKRCRRAGRRAAR